MNDDSGSLAVVFGAGPVGTEVAKRFLERGARVRQVTRSGRTPESLQNRVESLAADATDYGAVSVAAHGADFVVHCVNVSYEHWFEMLPPIQRNLIDAAVDNDAVFAASENLYMYAAPSGPIHEGSPEGSPSRKGRLRSELHQMLHDAERERGLRWVTVRASDYYGPGAGKQAYFGSWFLDPLFKGRKPGLFGDPDQLHSFAYVADFGRAIADASLDPSALNRTWIAPHDRPLTRRELAALFFRTSGKTGGIARIPTALLRLAGLVVPVIRELPELLYQFEGPFVVDDSAYRGHFGIEPTSLEEGVRRTIDWYRKLGRR